jgi:hypothetical protein
MTIGGNKTMSIDLSQDTIGGWHPDPTQRKWDCGSCFENEGRYLYSTVRGMRPAVIVEIGRHKGCSASHLALGCKHNGFGRVYSFDIDSQAGQDIPADLRPFIEFINADVFSLNWREKFNLPIDLLLEDGAHTTGFTEGVLRALVLELKGGNGLPDLSPKRVIVHDYCHFDCQKTVHAECLKVLGEPDQVFFEPPSDCGYAVYLRGVQR